MDMQGGGISAGEVGPQTWNWQETRMGGALFGANTAGGKCAANTRDSGGQVIEPTEDGVTTAGF